MYLNFNQDTVFPGKTGTATNNGVGYHGSQRGVENILSTSMRPMLMRKAQQAQQCHRAGMNAPHLYLAPRIPALAKEPSVRAIMAPR